ncbi:MAG TPA: 16S rRNA (cytosine(967)-C(5))-methyltransferase RsmB [Firmicutes bacterium]|nr:16S rRNA (cytosine(967)-C(5))-methyltransferase RsmB [Bacillota bacterium]
MILAANPRHAAVSTLLNYEKNKSYLNLELKKVFSGNDFSPRDKAFLTELVYGVVRYKLTLDWVLSLFLKKEVSRLHPAIRQILRSGCYQLLYLDRVPTAAACNESVKLAKRYQPSAAGMANAVLRNIARRKGKLPWPGNKRDYLSVKYSYPKWLIDRWLEVFSFDEAEELCLAANKPPVLTIRINTLKTKKELLLERLSQEGFYFTTGRIPGLLYHLRGRRDVTNTSAYREGLFTVQGEGSALASHLLNPRRQDLVVDLCSAPGGKATHIAQLLGGEGNIIAGDIHHHRLELIAATFKRLGLPLPELRVWDAADMPAAFLGRADKVLLDAPCSGLGVIGRKPDLKWHKHDESIALLSALQKRILAQGSRLLKQGGNLLYCVCTNEKEETEEVIDDFLSKNSGFAAIDLRDRMLPGIRGTAGKSGGMHLYPHRDGSDGFFYALLVRNC